jgi:hypothetical protein
MAESSFGGRIDSEQEVGPVNQVDEASRALGAGAAVRGVACARRPSVS